MACEAIIILRNDKLAPDASFENRKSLDENLCGSVTNGMDIDAIICACVAWGWRGRGQSPHKYITLYSSKFTSTLINAISWSRFPLQRCQVWPSSQGNQNGARKYGYRLQNKIFKVSSGPASGIALGDYVIAPRILDSFVWVWLDAWTKANVGVTLDFRSLQIYPENILVCASLDSIA